MIEVERCGLAHVLNEMAMLGEWRRGEEDEDKCAKLTDIHRGGAPIRVNSALVALH